MSDPISDHEGPLETPVVADRLGLSWFRLSVLFLSRLTRMVIQAPRPNSAARKPSASGATPPPASPRSPSLRALSRTRWKRKRFIMVISTILMVGSAGFVLMFGTQLRWSARAGNTSLTTNDIAASNHFDAKVFIDTTGRGDCQQEVFDNQTWRVTRSRQPCEATKYDANGNPIPKEATHRLDAISKAFRDK
jgi:hypothetical protein